jgi:hypothetical protein
MEYQKPTMISLGEAVVSIQGTKDKTLAIVVDAQHIPFLVTIAAYEADE